MNVNPLQRFYAVIAVTGLVAVFFVLFIVLFQREEKKRLIKDSNSILESVTHSKQQLISDWLQDEMNDVKLISKNQGFTELIGRFIEGKAYEGEVLSAFNQVKSEHDYAELVLLGETGEAIVSTNPALTFNDSIDKVTLTKALAMDSCYVTDIFQSSVDHHVYIDMVSVIRNAHGKPLGGVVFKIYAEDAIDKMLTDQVITGYKCLVSLVQQHADKKWVFYKPDSTLAFNRDWQPLPARFRNDPFNQQFHLVRLVQIAGTPWYLMVELDNSGRKAESGAFLSFASFWGVMSVLLFLLGLLLIVYYQEKKYSHKLKEKEEELERCKMQYFFTMDMLGESVFITDNQGMIQYMNLAAELISGWRLKDVEGKALDKEIPLLQEETGLPLLNVKNWFSGERAYHQYMPANLFKKDGSCIRVICSLAPIKGNQSEHDGLAVVLIKNDKKFLISPESTGETKSPVSG